jgi:hypothetical protein
LKNIFLGFLGQKSPKILGQKSPLKITKFFEFLGRGFLVADRVPDSVSQVGGKKFRVGKKIYAWQFAAEAVR